MKISAASEEKSLMIDTDVSGKAIGGVSHQSQHNASVVWIASALEKLKKAVLSIGSLQNSKASDQMVTNAIYALRLILDKLRNAKRDKTEGARTEEVKISYRSVGAHINGASRMMQPSYVNREEKLDDDHITQNGTSRAATLRENYDQNLIRNVTNMYTRLREKLSQYAPLMAKLSTHEKGQSKVTHINKNSTVFNVRRRPVSKEDFMKYLVNLKTPAVTDVFPKGSLQNKQMFAKQFGQSFVTDSLDEDITHGSFTTLEINEHLSLHTKVRKNARTSDNMKDGFHDMKPVSDNIIFPMWAVALIALIICFLGVIICLAVY